MKFKVKTKPRDLWVMESWHYRGAGFHKNKKKVIERKQKYKNQTKYPI